MVRQSQKQKIVIGTPSKEIAPSKTAKPRKAATKKKAKRATKGKPKKRKRAAGVGQRQSQSVKITLGGAQAGSAFPRAPWVFAPPFQQAPGPPTDFMRPPMEAATASKASNFVTGSDLSKVARAIADLEKQTKNLLTAQQSLQVENAVANAKSTNELLQFLDDKAAFWEQPPAQAPRAQTTTASQQTLSTPEQTTLSTQTIADQVFPPPTPTQGIIADEDLTEQDINSSWGNRAFIGAAGLAGAAAVGLGAASAVDLLTEVAGYAAKPVTIGLGGTALALAVSNIAGGASLAEDEGFAEPRAVPPLESAVADDVAVDVEPSPVITQQPTSSFLLDPWPDDLDVADTPLRAAATNNPLPVADSLIEEPTSTIPAGLRRRRQPPSWQTSGEFDMTRY